MTRGPARIATVIPTFNSAATLEYALESALAQSVPAAEIIVVDDGSTDESTSVAERYAPRVVVYRQPNSGAAAARNAGVARTDSELVAFLDADDVWHHRKLELQLAAMTARPDAVACYTDFEHITSYAAFDYTREHRTTLEVLAGIRDVFPNPYLGTPTVMVRRGAFEQCSGFDQGLRTAEDVDLWLRLSTLGPILHLQSSLTGVFQHPTGLSRSSGLQGDYNNLLVIDRFLGAHPDFAHDASRLVRAMKGSILTRIGAGLMGMRRWSEARSTLTSAVSTHPLSFRPYYLLGKCIAKEAMSARRQRSSQ